MGLSHNSQKVQEMHLFAAAAIPLLYYLAMKRCVTV
jgi:hypothetical protein